MEQWVVRNLCEKEIFHASGLSTCGLGSLQHQNHYDIIEIFGCVIITHKMLEKFYQTFVLFDHIKFSPLSHTILFEYLALE